MVHQALHLLTGWFALYENTDGQMKMHKCKILIHKYRNTNKNTNTQIQIHKVVHQAWWTTLCICIWVFVFLFVFLYLCISILHLCIFICPSVFSYSANQPVRRCSAWWTTLSNAAMNHDYTLWCAGAVCILHHHLTVSRSYFAILSRTYLITIIHTHTRKISGDQNFNFIFEEHKKRICLDYL